MLFVDPDSGRRARARRVLATIPARLVDVASHADAYARSFDACISVVILDGREAPMAAIDVLRRLRETQPFLVSILIGIEHEIGALIAATNEVGAFRVLRSHATDQELRSAVLGALRLERDRRVQAKLDRPWVRGLLERIEAALPAATMAKVDEEGAELPVDLILREHPRVQYRGGDVV